MRACTGVVGGGAGNPPRAGRRGGGERHELHDVGGMCPPRGARRRARGDARTGHGARGDHRGRRQGPSRAGRARSPVWTPSTEKERRKDGRHKRNTHARRVDAEGAAFTSTAHLHCSPTSTGQSGGAPAAPHTPPPSPHPPPFTRRYATEGSCSPISASCSFLRRAASESCFIMLKSLFDSAVQQCHAAPSKPRRQRNKVVHARHLLVSCRFPVVCDGVGGTSHGDEAAAMWCGDEGGG